VLSLSPSTCENRRGREKSEWRREEEETERERTKSLFFLSCSLSQTLAIELKKQQWFLLSPLSPAGKRLLPLQRGRQRRCDPLPDRSGPRGAKAPCASRRSVPVRVFSRRRNFFSSVVNSALGLARSRFLPRYRAHCPPNCDGSNHEITTHDRGRRNNCEQAAIKSYRRGAVALATRFRSSLASTSLSLNFLSFSLSNSLFPPFFLINKQEETTTPGARPPRRSSSARRSLNSTGPARRRGETRSYFSFLPVSSFL
jgi:hypothetical protein